MTGDPKFDLNNSITLFKVPQRNVLQGSRANGDMEAALTKSSILLPPCEDCKAKTKQTPMRPVVKC